MDTQHGPTLQHRELCSNLGSSLDGRGVIGRMAACVHALRPFAVHLNLLQHCQSAIAQCKIKSLKK